MPDKSLPTKNRLVCSGLNEQNYSVPYILHFIMSRFQCTSYLFIDIDVIHFFILQVGDAGKSTKVCNDLLTDHGIYVQAINYPTVPRGEEKLRIAPTPFHTDEMMDHFVASLVNVWAENDLGFLTPVCTASCDCQERCVSNYEFAFNRHATTVGA